jgi:hypothetical protein
MSDKNQMKSRAEEHLSMMVIIKHNIDGIIRVGKLAERDHGETVSRYRIEAEQLATRLSENRDAIEHAYSGVMTDLTISELGQPIDLEAFKAKSDKLFKLFDESFDINAEVMDLAGALQADPKLADSVTTNVSLPGGSTKIPAGAAVHSQVALSTRKKIILTDAYEIIDFVSSKASNAPIKKLQEAFGMSIIDAVLGGNRNQGVKVAATFTPGKARVGGSSDYSFGYRWEMSAAPSGSRDPSSMLTGICFMTVNDRDLFSRFYVNPDSGKAAAEVVFQDFTPDEEMGTNLH